MDELPISIVSSDLKYSLSNLKIKTLEKAREFAQNSTEDRDRDKVRKITKYLTRYDAVKMNIAQRLNTCAAESEPWPSLESRNTIKPEQVIQKSIVEPSIIEIMGEKSIGKTAFLMHFCERFAEKHPEKKVFFINSTSGMSYMRFRRLSQKCRGLEYRDTYVLEQVLEVCKAAAEDEKLGCIAVDSLTNLMMEEEKTMIFVIKLFKIFSSLVQKGVIIYMTNYVQTWFEMADDTKLMNNCPYFSALTSEYIRYKYLLFREQGEIVFQTIRGADIKGRLTVQSDGLRHIELIKE